MRFRRPNFHSVRDLFVTILVIAFVSLLVTYQLGRYLPRHQHTTELKIHFKGRVDIFRGDAGMLESGAAVEGKMALLGEQRQGLEGMDIEEWERRKRERQKEVTTPPGGDKKSRKPRARRLDPKLLRHLQEVR